MSEESNKKEIGIYTPLWYLQLNSRYNKYQKRNIILMMYLFFGLYVWVPFSSPELHLKLEDVYIYYLVFYILYSITGYILWKLLYAKYKLNPSEVLALNFFRVSLDLEKIGLDKNLETSLKKNLRFLIKEMKFIKRKHLNSVSHQNLINLFTIWIKNLNKVNSSDKNKGINLGVSTALKIISEKVYNSNINVIEDELQHYSVGLINYPRIKFTNKILNWKKNISENFQVYGIILIILLIIAIYKLPEHQLVLSGFLIAIVSVWLNGILRS